MKRKVIKRVRVEGRVRAARLEKIRRANYELQSCLLTLKEHFKITWTDEGFRDLHYLVNLARKAP